MTNRQPHLLVFEPDPRGHTCEWIEHLLAALPDCPGQPLLSLAVADDLAPMLAKAIARFGGNRVRVYSLSAHEQALCLHRRLAVSGLARWWFMRRHLRRTGATHGLFLEFDHLSLPLGLGLPLGRPVSGILFRPSVHYAVFDPSRPTWRERLRDWRKDALYRLMLANPALASVLSLDPDFATFATRRYRHGAKVASLSDPAPAVSAAPAGDTPVMLSTVPGGRILFVLFGELTARKGAVPLLEALAALPEDVAERTAVVVAGRLDTTLRPAVQAALARVTSARPGLWLHLEDRRLSEEGLAALVGRSDVVLAPYQRFVGSSGILMRAAQAGRPVICQDYGLLGHQVRRHRLGLTVDTTDPAALAGALAEAVRRGPAALADSTAMAAFVAPHTPESFARTVLGHALAGTADPARRRWLARPGAVPK